MSDIEKENLGAHVEICAERYSALEYRLGSLENKLDDLAKATDQTRMLIIKSIGAATGILSLVISITIVILSNTH